jgi:hypothetical protein
MKGVYSKKAIASVVDPLKAILNVFNNTSVHVVYESESKSIHISVVNQKKSVYAMYELKADEIIEDYEAPRTEIGIWEVNQFVNILGKYIDDVYADQVIIDFDEKQQNKMIITCGDETTEYFLAQLHLFNDTRCKARKLKTDTLTKACEFELSGVDLKKLTTNINVFDEQDEITLIGSKDEGVKVRLSSSSGTVFSKNESKLREVEVEDEFELKFPKADFKGLLKCNGSFDFTVYTGKKQIVNANYERDNYKMDFYFAPLAD